MSTYLIITTVGTSIFSNFNKQKVKLAFERSREGRDVYGGGVDINDFEDCTAQDYIGQRVTLTSIEEKIEDFWLRGIEKTDEGWDWKGPNSGIPNHHASAEITSILKVAEKIKKDGQGIKIEVKLLATDTALSVSAAKMISQFPFSENQEGICILPFKSEVDYIPSLGVHPPERQNESQYYDEGLQQLVERLIGEKGIIKNQKKKINPVINFSGGYKAIIPFLTIIAQLEDIPMYYIYEESDYLMEVGGLPVNFDWLAIEALKPLLKNYILKEKLNTLAPFLSQGLIGFKDGKYQLKEDESKEIPVLEEFPSIFHRSIHGLLSYKLTRLNNEQQFEITPLGKIVSKVDVAADKGFVMEHLLFKYFSSNAREGFLKDYQTHTTSIDERPFGYIVTDIKTSQIEIVEQKPKNRDKSVREIGDIDIPLRNGKSFVWAESKAYSTACNYHKKIRKDEDYFFQLKARAKSIEKYFDSMESLFLVFRFVIKDINDNHFLDSKQFKDVLKRFEELNEDEDLKGIASFRCIGISIPIDFDKDRIDFTSFYKGDFSNWIFEELKTTEHA